MFIKIKFLGNIITALVDTGANASYLDNRILNSAHIDLTDSQPFFVRSTKFRLEVMGRVKLNLRLHRIKKEMNFNVVEELPFQMVLGLDAMELFNLDIVRLCVVQRINQHSNKHIKITTFESTLSTVQANVVETINNIQAHIPINRYVSRNPYEQIGKDLNSLFVQNSYCNATDKPDISLHCSDTEDGRYSILKTAEKQRLFSSIISEPEFMTFENCEKLPVSETLCRIDLNRVEVILTKHKPVFALGPYDIGAIPDVFVEIRLKDNVPIALKPYRLTRDELDIVRQKIKELLDHKIIKRSRSAYSFPITLVDKKGEKKGRLCVDFRPLNSKAIIENFPIPRIEDLIDKLRDRAVFSTLDIVNGFYNLRVHPGDTHKLAFSTPEGHYEFCVLPYGYVCSPMVFQREIYNILSFNDLTEFAWNYLDDTVIASKNLTEHLEHLDKVLKVLAKHNIKLKLSKCHFAMPEIDYLGHRISLNCIKPLNDKIKAIIDLPAPRTVKEVRALLGRINFYRKFIKNAAATLHPISNLTKKHTEFVWDNECQDAFEQIKKILTSEPLLCIFEPSLQTTLFCDASIAGVGAVLKQVQKDGSELPVAYFSKKLLDYQTRYITAEIECYAIVSAINFFHHYLYGMEFTVCSDHRALQWLFKHNNHRTRLANWSLALSQYNFKVKYIKGAHNAEADFLSRYGLAERELESDEVEQREYTPQYFIEVIEEFTDDNRFLEEVQEQVKVEGRKIIASNEIPEGYEVLNDMIVHVQDGVSRLFVPAPMRDKVLKAIHFEFLHPDKRRMLGFLSNCYHWPGIDQSVEKFIASCTNCQSNKVKRARESGSIQKIDALEPFHVISCDSIGGLEHYGSSKRYLHIAIDHFSRYIWILASRTQTALDMINLLNLVLASGTPQIVLTDRYASFNSYYFKNFLNNKNITLLHTPKSSGHSLGMAERANQTLIGLLRTNYNDQANRVKNWAKLVHLVLDKYRHLNHSVTGFPPAFILNGEDRYGWFQNTDLESAREKVKSLNQADHERNKYHYDQRHNADLVFEVGQTVMVKNKIDKRYRKKLDPLQIGPYEITERLSDTRYIVDIDGKKLEQNVANLRPIELNSLCTCGPEKIFFKGQSVIDPEKKSIRRGM